MSNAFNPFAQSAVAPTPVQAAAQPAQAPTPQRPVVKGLDDVSANGFNTQFFRHIDGDWDLKITGYAGLFTDKLKDAVHITFEIMTSTTPDLVPVGSCWRIAYKYDFERGRPAANDPYGTDCEDLSRFVQALCNPTRAAGFKPSEVEPALHKHDWATQPAFVHLRGVLGPPKESKKDPGSMMRFRRDNWSPCVAPKD